MIPMNRVTDAHVGLHLNMPLRRLIAALGEILSKFLKEKYNHFRGIN